MNGVSMGKWNLKICFLWTVVALLTMLCLLSFYESCQNIRLRLLEKSQVLFQQEVQEDTDRRTRELGDDFCFFYTGGTWLESDSITIEQADTIIRIKNNKEIACRMSSQEKADFCLQYYLSLKNGSSDISSDAAVV